MKQAVGKYVLLKTLDISDKTEVNSFYIPNISLSNFRLGKYEVISAGSIAKEQYGIKEGSIVYADRLACLNWRSDTPIIEYTSIIYEYDEETHDYIPFKNMVMVESDEQFKKTSSSSTFSIIENALPIGTIIASNSKMFNVGDIILLPNGGDVVQINDKIIHIYLDKDIHCKYEL